MHAASVRWIGTLVGLCLASTTTAGPISPYYLINGDARSVRVLQGNSVINTWTLPSNSYPLAVVDTVRTYATNSSNFGSEFTLAGTSTGVTYAPQANIQEALDGATDGAVHNYLIAHQESAVYQFDRDWQHPTLLFTLPTRPTGITFDQNSGNLWIARDGDRRIEQYTTSGTLISSFSFGTGRLGGLAWEPATDTLWGYVLSTRNMRQFSKTGQLLETATFGTNVVSNSFGGEFALPDLTPPPPPPPPPTGAVPEPASLFLAATAGIVLTWQRRLLKRRSSSAPAPGPLPCR